MKAALSQALGLAGAMLSVVRAGCCRPLARAATSLSASTLAAALCLTSVAIAQAPARAEADQPSVQEVVITGSRIAAPNATSTSPIQVLTSQDITLAGATDVGNVLNQMPQVTFTNGVDLSNRSNPLSTPGGEATVDLRGLGPQRTLVLVNGRRLGPGDANTGNPNPGADVNQIPVQLIERVEVVTGGASATYGSDAIGGVVNFIMKKDFQGLEFDSQYGLDYHSNHSSAMQSLLAAQGFPVPSGSVTDGRNRAFTLVMGSNTADAKGNVTAYFNYRSADPVSQGNRDFAACLLKERGNNATVCTGSPNSNLFSAGVGLANEFDFSVVGNQALPYPQAGSVPPPVFNSSPYQYFSSQTSRYMGGLFAHYDLTDWAKPYLEFNYMNDKSSIQIGPSGMFYGGDPKSPVTFPAGSGPDGASAYIPCNSALFSAQETAALAPFCGINGAPPGYVGLFIGRRNIEGGPRSSDWEHNNYRVVGGVKGDLTEAWNYDAYFSNYYTTLNQFNGGYLSYSAINNALNVGAGGTCLTGGGSCSPYQIFTQGGVTAAQVAALTTPATEGGFVRERIVSGSLTGELGKYGVKSPLANDGIAINVGAEFRNDVLNFQPDAASLSNDLGGFSGASTPINNAKTSVTEEFAELRVPILQSEPWARELVFDTGYRHSSYTPAGGANTYKFELQYLPIQDVRFRGSFQRALRAPNIIELFNPNTVTNTSVVSSDPCAGLAPTASLADCMHTGLTAAQYGHIPQCPANQCSTLTGGNPRLGPETANTTSFGLTLTPTFFNNFEASIDFYRIILKQEIATVPLSTSLNECLTTGDPTFCSLVVRSGNGILFGNTIAGGGYISGTAVNVAGAEVRGVDVQSGYRVPMRSLGTLTFNLNGTYLANTTFTPLPGFGTFDCAGLYGKVCASVNPRWRHNLRMNYTLPWPDFLVSLQWRYIGTSSLDTNSSNPLLTDGKINTLLATVGSVNYLDLSAEWTINKSFLLRAGINNILDKDPPIIPTDITSTGSGNVFASYDTLGREVFAGFRARF
jgi:iron complex outermembrane receptor protein